MIWKESLGQVERGWLAPPLPIDIERSVATYAHGSFNIDFRFGVAHADKLGAFGGLQHNEDNLCRTIWMPIKLPTCDHIGQMRLNVGPSEKTCEFFKAGHEAAYKQLPMRPEHSNLAMVALRDPVTSRWMAFHPKALLFGANSAVLRYRCFSLLSAVLFNRIFGIPLVEYFDDFGAIGPGNVARMDLRTLERFCHALGAKLKRPRLIDSRGSFSSDSGETSRQLPTRFSCVSPPQMGKR